MSQASGLRHENVLHCTIIIYIFLSRQASKTSQHETGLTVKWSISIFWELISPKRYYILAIIPETCIMYKQNRTSHFSTLSQLCTWRRAVQSAPSSHQLIEAWLIRTSLHTSVVTSKKLTKCSMTFNSKATCDWTAKEDSVMTQSLTRQTEGLSFIT